MIATMEGRSNQRGSPPPISYWVGYLFCIFLGIAIALLVRPAASPRAVASPTAGPVGNPVVSADGYVNFASSTVAVPPWGMLEFRRVPLEDRQQVLVDGAERLKPTRWHFIGCAPEQVLELFHSVGLTGNQTAELGSTNHWECREGDCVISPTDDTLLTLSPTARAAIYGALARYSTNYGQFFPFRFAGKVADRLGECGLAQDSLKQVESMAYTNCHLLSFCDLEPLQRRLAPAEFSALTRALYSVPAVMLQVRIKASQDIDRLIQYWGAGGRAQRIRPLLDSLGGELGESAISVSYFFPPFARLRLYTFPDPSTDAAEAKQDCFYTALNFFSDKPDEGYLKVENTRRALVTDYTMVAGQPQFGDLLAVINGRGDALHVAVYVAADVVFTKNGANYLQPWTLMRIPDMMTYFPSEEPLRVVMLRKKALMNPSLEHAPATMIQAENK